MPFVFFNGASDHGVKIKLMVNDINLWSNKYSLPEEYVMYKLNSCDLFLPVVSVFAVNGSFIYFLGRVTVLPPCCYPRLCTYVQVDKGLHWEHVK